MNDDKKITEELLPEDKKRALEEMPDHLKSSLHDVKNKNTIQDEANNKE